ncbi:hypothetical protein Droror1_Dr00017915 [Drosera rotundifolia]
MQHVEEEHARSKAEWKEKGLQLMNYLKATEEEVSSLNQEVVRLRGSLKEVEIQESSTSSVVEVFVGGLDREVEEEDLRKAFQKVGDVVEVRLLKDPVTGKNRGFAFVRFATKEQESRALAKMMNPVIRGKRCGNAASEGNGTLVVEKGSTLSVPESDSRSSDSVNSNARQRRRSGNYEPEQGADAVASGVDPDGETVGYLVEALCMDKNIEAGCKLLQ